MTSFKSLWQLLRLEHGVMYGIGVLVGIFVADPDYCNLNGILFGFLTAVFLQASAFALNDYLDYEVDVANKRYDRPLVRGELSKETALYISIILLPPGLVAAFLISPIAIFFAIAITLLGYFYDIKLKELGISGNAYIALTMAAPFLFGSIVATGTIVASSALLSSMAFLSGLGREIMKGIEDVEGDELRDVKSVARMKGEKVAAIIAACFFVIAVSISPIPIFYLEHYLMDFKYAISVAVTDILLIYVALKLLGDYRKEAIKRYRKQTLIAMVFGLIGFLTGIY